MTLKVGIIGLGAVSDMHLVAYQDVQGIDVVAAAEPIDSRLQEKVAQHGFRGYSDYKVMLEQESLDIACVLAPVNLHCEISEACAKAGVHVLCEKPIAISLFDAERIVATCEKHEVKLFYGASYRFLPAVQLAKQQIASGAIGDVLLMTETLVGGKGRESHVPIGFVHYPEGGPGGSGLGLVDHGVHLLDLFPWLVDSKITRVFGRGNISGKPPVTEYAQIHLANGAVGNLIYSDFTFDSILPTEGVFSRGASWSISGYEPADTWHTHPGFISIYGTSGSLRILHYANQLFLNDRNGLRQLHPEDRPPPAQFALQLESFVAAVKNDLPCEVSGQSGVIALRVLHAIYESDKAGMAINIQDELRAA